MPQENAASFASGTSTQSMIYVIAMLLLIFVAAYLVTRFVGGKAKMGAGQGRIRHMQVLETLSLGRDRSVVMVEVGGKYCLIGVSGQNVSLIGMFDPEDLTPIVLEESAVMGTAKGMADRILQWNQNRKNNRGNGQAPEMRQSPRQEAHQENRQNTLEEDEMDEILQSIRERRERYEKDGEDRRP